MTTLLPTEWRLRLAEKRDIPALHALIEASVRGLQAGDYTPAQIEGALGTVLGLDTQLIRDQTYFVVEAAGLEGGRDERRIAACGGWSRRKTLFGSDHAAVREPELLDPAIDAAKVRAIFVHPDFARRGLGSLVLAQMEAAGFRWLDADWSAALPAQGLCRGGAGVGLASDSAVAEWGGLPGGGWLARRKTKAGSSAALGMTALVVVRVFDFGAGF